jgi:hypothetical protein
MNKQMGESKPRLEAKVAVIPEEPAVSDCLSQSALPMREPTSS